jgi:hypothetical protein
MRKFAPLVLALFLTACGAIAPERLDCDQITASVLRAQIGKQFAPEEFLAWVSDVYRVPQGNTRLDTAGAGRSSTLYWQGDGISYIAVIDGSGLASVSLAYKQRRPSAAEVVACLSAPEQYRASYGSDIPGNNLQLDLLFPAQGVLVFGNQFLPARPQQPPPIEGKFEMSHMTVVSPGPADQVLRGIYGRSSADLVGSMLPQYKPWPGDWKDIVISVDPSLRQ